MAPAAPTPPPTKAAVLGPEEDDGLVVSTGETVVPEVVASGCNVEVVATLFLLSTAGATEDEAGAVEDEAGAVEDEIGALVAESGAATDEVAPV